MTTAQLQKMQQGRQRALKRRQEHAVSRVHAFQAWLRAGSVTRDVPEIPSDADYRLARAAGVVR